MLRSVPFQATRDMTHPQMRRSFGFRLPTALLLLALLGGCVSAPLPRQSLPAVVSAEDRPAHNLALYDAIWTAVSRYYYDPQLNGSDWEAARQRHRAEAAAATDNEQLYDAINAMLAEIGDEHTHASSPAEVRTDHERRGIFVGLVMAPDPANGEPATVVRTMPGSSAAEAGVGTGWILLSCDGRPPHEVLGPGKLSPGQTIHCEFLDDQEQHRTIALTAREVELVPVLESRMLADGQLYLRFDEFDRRSWRWLRNELKTHRDARGVIVDLRANPGGEAAAVERALGEFFPREVPVGEFIRRDGRSEPLRAEQPWGAARYSGPLAVLVSPASGSSSEIFAHVIQHYQRGVIIGEQTRGSVLGAEITPLPDGGELQLSLRDYRGPAGQRLEGVGVSPDLVVDAHAAVLPGGDDATLEAATMALRKRVLTSVETAPAR